MTKKTINERGPGKSSAFRNRDGRFEKALPKEGRTVARDPSPAKGGSFSYATRVSSPIGLEPEKRKLARPVKQPADPREFAADLLVTDKIIMDYLAK
ncbi:hypothetical protein [Rhizobium leguminosarum]|uniref:Uncharacterized protein n=1 Tax=Rhizobium leguminosarum TaxID=384 RepID=A0A2Z4YMA4_RHILE|nr:hypothetical protein [Rhizobium leguminosarum]AXA41738.1 hypothetical protein DLJ82_4175 [Rhizobium leguminosarum]